MLFLPLSLNDFKILQAIPKVSETIYKDARAPSPPPAEPPYPPRSWFPSAKECRPPPTSVQERVSNTSHARNPCAKLPANTNEVGRLKEQQEEGASQQGARGKGEEHRAVHRLLHCPPQWREEQDHSDEGDDVYQDRGHNGGGSPGL